MAMTCTPLISLMAWIISAVPVSTEKGATMFIEKGARARLGPQV